MRTRFTELIGIEHPIQCGTMQWLSRAELVAAVANAGGFACLAAATFPGEGELASEIRKTRRLTKKPFGVNVSLFPSLRPQTIESLIDVAAAEGVGIIETAGRNPEPYRGRIIEAGLIHIHKCARVRDAMKADRLGVDAVAVVGAESGGHPGMEGISSMVLFPMAADAINVPLILGGGLCDGRSLMAALCLGADAVVMGTRFLCTKECIAHPRVKERLLAAGAMDTTLVLASFRNPGRVLKNRWAEKVLEMERVCASFEELAPAVRGEVSCRGWLEGCVDEALFSCGQVVGRIKDIPTVSELMEIILEEARLVQARMDQLKK